VANGFVLMAGDKMSKSLENIIPLRQAVAKFGADPLRIATLATAELNQDTDFSETLATTIQDRLVSLISQSRKLGRKTTARTVYSHSTGGCSVVSTQQFRQQPRRWND